MGHNSWAAEVKVEPKLSSKRRSPVQPSLQPAAKKGRLVRQRSPPTSTEGASMDSDATMEECVTPSRQGKGKKNALESDVDEDYVPGQPASLHYHQNRCYDQVKYVCGRPCIFRVGWADDPSEVCQCVVQSNAILYASKVLYFGEQCVYGCSSISLVHCVHNIRCLTVSVRHV